ncbi:MAG: DNA-processing protein DprA [Bacteroidales bacterium]|nr:DNA-processing protein DprA [Bacteroidales bacterium]
MDTDILVYVCALSKVFAYKCAAGRQLADTLGGPSAVFTASHKTLRDVLHHADLYVDALTDPSLLEWARAEVEWAAGNGVELLPYFSTRYPRRLAECDDAPLMLYYKGNADLNARRVLAVVGTRKATWYGRECCRRIVARLAALPERPLIVSGLALGVDGCAHLAALENGLQTVGVMPTGMDEIYPVQHRSLARRIEGQGGLVTDFPRLTAPVAHTFIRRNRLIAGMADATLLVESYARGGGLITVSLADSYGREVFAVPGRLTDPSFAGCHDMIARNIAQLVKDPDSIPLAMGWVAQASVKGRTSAFRPDDSPLKRAVLRLLGERGSLTADELAVLTHEDASAVSVVLFELEVEGRAAAEFGNKYARVGG